MIPKLTKANIELAEATFGVKLPASYVKVLEERNGGYLKTDAVPVNCANDWAEDHIHLDELYGIGQDEGIMETEYLRNEWGITKGDIIIIGGDGHAFVALDYEGTTTDPKVIHIDTDSSKVNVICDSFDALLRIMYVAEDPDDDEMPHRIDWKKKLKNVATIVILLAVCGAIIYKGYMYISDWL
ncbi:SMI1/KNR4 family protein [Listeria grandensis]|uniref:SMI1/KNR4 family protein n=1 Tax=Listeria grandensis TaxID=1494963 RepID=UPI00162A725D|nr:SMI1/KNR4 family protein [Listeria grandensis]MBC1474233.1 SMI1/KNR4 family protein [Listeria grandensis]